MSFRRAFSRSMRDMFHRKEFFAALTASLLLLLVPTALDIIGYFGRDAMYLDPAWSYWGTSAYKGADGIVHARWVSWGTFLAAIVLPFLASLAYSYCCFDDAKSGALNFLVTRTGRGSYYSADMLTAFLGGFLVLFLPLALDQLILCIAFPLNSIQTISMTPVTDELAQNMRFFRSLYLNHPYLYNSIYCVIPGIAAGLMGTLSFSISLLFRKSRFLVLTIPGIVWIFSVFLLSNAGVWKNVISLITPDDGSGVRMSEIILLFAALILLNLGAMAYKLRIAKDEL